MTSELKLDEGTEVVVVRGDIRVQFNGNGVTLDVRRKTIIVDNNGTVEMQTAANDAAAKAAPEIGAIESSGDHKGKIYGGLWPEEYGGDNKPIWISEEPEPMSHYDAVELKGRALPTRDQGKYINTIKDKGALKDIFARHSDGSSFAGYFWLAGRTDYGIARSQQFSDGSQQRNFYYRDNHLPVLSVIR